LFSLIPPSVANIDENVQTISFTKTTQLFPQNHPLVTHDELDPTLGTLGTDILVWGDEDMDAQNPTIASNGGAGLILGCEGWEDQFIPPNPFFRYSLDGGQSWLPEDSAVSWDLIGAGYDSIIPDVDYGGGNRAFGTILPFGQTDWMTFNFPNILDDEAEGGWVANGWLASVMMSNWDSVDSCGVNQNFAPSPDAYGFCVWTGDTLDGVENGIYFGWEISEGSEFVVYPDEEYV
jgi:hypothetical protein